MSAVPERPRRRLSAQARRTQLVEAAVVVVASTGYQRTGADAVVARAGVSKGLLWHYFEGLEDLMLATAEHCFATLTSAVVDGLDRSLPVPDLLRAAIHAASRLPASHRDEIAALRQIVTNLRRPDGSPRLDETAYDDLYAGQAELFRAGQRDGDIRPGLDPVLLSVTYQAAVDGMITHLHRHPEVDAERYADARRGGPADGAAPLDVRRTVGAATHRGRRGAGTIEACTTSSCSWTRRPTPPSGTSGAASTRPDCRARPGTAAPPTVPTSP